MGTLDVYIYKWRQLGRSALLATFIVTLLILSGFRQARDANRNTVIARLFGDMVNIPRSNGVRSQDWLVVSSNGGWVVERRVDTDQARANGQQCVVVVLAEFGLPYGLWHPIIDAVDTHVTFREIDANTEIHDNTQRQQILAAIERSHPGTFSAERLAFIAKGGGPTRRLLWSGLLGDLSVVVGLLLLFVVLSNAIDRIAGRRPGTCVRCGYDLRGLWPAVCPECGEPTDPSAPKGTDQIAVRSQTDGAASTVYITKDRDTPAQSTKSRT